MNVDPGLLLAQMPLEVMVPAAVLLSVLFAALGTWTVGQLISPEALRENVIVGAILSDVAAVIYSVSLALVLIGAFSHFTAAQTAVQREAATLETLDRAAMAFDLPEQTAESARMRATVRAYARAVVEQEWRSGASGRESAHVGLRLSDLANAFLLVEPVTARQRVLHQNVVAWVREVSELRRFRLTTLSRSLAAMTWAVSLAGLAIAVVLPWFMELPGGALVRVTMSALLSLLVVMHLIVALHLAYPFSGDTAISPTALLGLGR